MPFRIFPGIDIMMWVCGGEGGGGEGGEALFYPGVVKLKANLFIAAGDHLPWPHGRNYIQ